MLLTEKGKPDTTARHVLAVLAECAQPDGSEARPSITTLQYRTGYDRRTVQRALRRLEDGGLIKAEGLKYGCTSYRLLLHVKRPASDWEALQKDEERQREMDAERQRRSRARRVTHSNDVTVTDAECVTGTDVTDADDVSHALSVPTSRTQNPDVTHATPPYKSFEPSGEKSSLSSSGAPAPDDPAPPAAPDEREKDASLSKTTTTPVEVDPLVQKLMRDHEATEQEATAVLAQVRREGKIGNLVGWALSATGSLDIRQRLTELRRPQGAGKPELSPWCGECEGEPVAERWVMVPDAEGYTRAARCPRCNPYHPNQLGGAA
jgi:DNA-binding Lrp family transcriptional regulator